MKNSTNKLKKLKKEFFFYADNISVKSHNIDLKSTNESKKNLFFTIDKLIIPKKGICLFTGESGCGKSTLINILGLMLKPDINQDKNMGILFWPEIRGKTIKYYDLYNNKKKIEEIRNKYFGFMFQQDQLIDSWLISENILLPMWLNKYKNQFDKSKLQNRLKKILSLLNFRTPSDILSKYPSQLSGGQKQRIALARAVIHSPKIIIADEPLASVERHTSELIINYLLNAASKRLVILVLHDIHLDIIHNKIRAKNEKLEQNKKEKIICKTYYIPKFIIKSNMIHEGES